MRLSVTQTNYNDQMHLQAELDIKALTQADITSEVAEISDSLKKITKLSGVVELVAIGTLADDGKVIDDLRPIG